MGYVGGIFDDFTTEPTAEGAIADIEHVSKAIMGPVSDSEYTG